MIWCDLVFELYFKLIFFMSLFCFFIILIVWHWLQDDETHGEIVLDLEGGKMFSVAQHQNNPNLNFLCLESKRVELYHQGTHCGGFVLYFTVMLCWCIFYSVIFGFIIG